MKTETTSICCGAPLICQMCSDCREQTEAVSVHDEQVQAFLAGGTATAVLNGARSWIAKRVNNMRRGGLAARGRSGRKIRNFTPQAKAKRDREQRRRDQLRAASEAELRDPVDPFS